MARPQSALGVEVPRTCSRWVFKPALRSRILINFYLPSGLKQQTARSHSNQHREESANNMDSCDPIEFRRDGAAGNGKKAQHLIGRKVAE